MNVEGHIERDWKMPHYWFIRWRMGPQAKKCRHPLEAGKDEEIGSFLEAEETLS